MYRDYRPPRLVVGKCWYVEYYASDVYGHLKRVRVKCNLIRDRKERRKHAERMMREITRKLDEGWSPFIEDSALKEYRNFDEVCEIYKKEIRRTSEDNTYRTYNGALNILRKWLDSKGYDHDMLISEFTPKLATDYIMSLRAQPDKYSMRTCNNYLNFCSRLFKWMMEFSYAADNPFGHIKSYSKRLYQKKRDILTDEQRTELYDFLTNRKDYNYLAMCYLCYYCFIRPKEIALLRISDIDLKNQTVHIDEKIAKNNKESWRTIPDVAMPVMRRLDLSHPADWFVFSFADSLKFTPGTKHTDEREIARYWADIVRPGLKWPMTLQFYSLKDTGITNMLEDGVATNEVQGQADHSSLEMTSVYARKVTPRSKIDIRKKPRSFAQKKKKDAD